MANDSIITNLGKNIVINRAYKPTPDYTAPTQFKVGILNGTPALADTDLDVPVAISGTEAVDNCDAITGWVDSADMTVTLNNTTYKEGTGSINLTKDGVATDTASTDKTTTSRDFTSKTLYVWFYIKDATAYAKLAATDCLTIRFGSDNSNYYYYTRDASNLSTGWNLIYYSTATADGTQGAPTIGACDYSYIAIKATGSGITWSAGDMIMDDWKLASASDYFSTVVSGYPTIDESLKEVTMRGFLSVTDANGYDINGFAWFNTDATPKMFSEDTFTAESKSETDEFVLITVDDME
jgi:hypothetical protein